VYAAAAAAFVLLAGYEGARMAAGHDPALATARHARPAPTAQPYPGGGFVDPDDAGPQGGFEPGAQGSPDDGQVPQPESRLS
jgi:hypothetical protein